MRWNDYQHQLAQNWYGRYQYLQRYHESVASIDNQRTTLKPFSFNNGSDKTDNNGDAEKSNAEKWEFFLQQAHQFNKRYGLWTAPTWSLAPADGVEVDPATRRIYQLGSWVKRQRYNYKKGTLKEQRINKLEEIGFSWDNDARFSQIQRGAWAH